MVTNARINFLFRSLSLMRTTLFEKSETTKYRVRSSSLEGLTKIGGRGGGGGGGGGAQICLQC